MDPMEYEDIVAAIAIIDMARNGLADLDGFKDHDEIGVLDVMRDARNMLNKMGLAALPDGARNVGDCTLTTKS